MTRRLCAAAAVVAAGLVLDQALAQVQRRRLLAELDRVSLLGRAEGVSRALLRGVVTEQTARERMPDPDVWAHLERTGQLAYIRNTVIR